MKLGLSLGNRNMPKLKPKIHLIAPAIQVIPNQPYMDISNFTAIIEVSDTTPHTNTGNGVLFHMGESAGNNNRYILYKVGGDADIDLLIQSGGTVRASTSRLNTILRSGKKQRWGISAIDGVVKLYLNGVYIDGFLSHTQPVVANPVISVGTQQNNVSNHYDDPGQSLHEFIFYDRGLDEEQMRRLTQTHDHDNAAVFDPHLKLLMVGGQSNAVGMASGTNTYANAARMKRIAGKGGLEDYTDPADNGTAEIFSSFFADTSPAAQNGFHGALLDTLAAYDTDSQFAVHVCAKGGTSFNSAWKPLTYSTSTRYQVSDMTYCYLQRLFLARAHAPIAAHIWYQGESDAYENVSEAHYALHLSRLYDLIRTTHGDIPLVTVSIHDDMNGATYPAKNAIRSAQTNLVYPGHSVVPAAGIETDAGKLHHTQAGYNALGAALATHLQTQVFG